MCLMSAPAAKKPSMRDAITTTLISGVASAWSSAAVRPSTIGRPSALAGGRFRTIVSTPSPASSQRTTASWAAATVVSGIVPLHRAGGQDVRAQRAPEHALHVAAGVQQLGQVDAGVDAHLMEHGDQ